MGCLTSVHGIGKLDKDGMLLHDPLNVLTTNTDDALVILVGDVEGDGGRHLLLNQGQPLPHGLETRRHDIDVEVVLVEAVEDDLNVA